MLYGFINSVVAFQFFLIHQIIKFLEPYSRYYSDMNIFIPKKWWTANFSSSMVLSFTLYNIANWEEIGFPSESWNQKISLGNDLDNFFRKLSP